MLVQVHLKKNFVLALSVVEILHFSIFRVVSMDTLIEEVSNNTWFNFFCHFCEWWGQLHLLTNVC